MGAVPYLQSRCRSYRAVYISRRANNSHQNELCSWLVQMLLFWLWLHPSPHVSLNYMTSIAHHD